MFNKSKRIVAVILGLVLLLAACNTTNGGTPSSSGSSGDVSWEEEEVSSEIKVTHEIITDTSEPMASTLEITGDHVVVSADLGKFMEDSGFKMAQKAIELDDGNMVLLYASPQSNPFEIIAIKIDTKTGKLLEKTLYSINSNYNYSYTDINRDKNIEGDVVVATDLSTFVFDLHDLSKPPVEYKMDEKVVELLQNFKLENLDNKDQGYVLSIENSNVKPGTSEVVYATNDGIFITNLKGDNPEKIVDQPEPQIWLPEQVLEEAEEGDVPKTAEYKDNPLYNVNANAVYSKPRFTPDGTKIIVEVTHFSSPLGRLGLAIIDIAKKEVIETFYYHDFKGNIADDESVWETHAQLWNVSYNFKDDNTLVLTFSGYFNGNTKRYDLFYDLEKEEVTNQYLSDTGITTDYEVVAVNDSNKGVVENIMFFDMVKGGKILGNKNEVFVKDSYSLALAVTQNKTLIELTGASAKDGEHLYIFVNNPA